MDLTVYDIVKGPVVTDKAYKLNSKLKQLIIEVHMHANKSLVRQALEKLFNVKVEKVRIVIRKGKLRLSNKKRPIQGKSVKKAIITLKEGYSIDALGQPGVDVAAMQPEEQSTPQKDQE
jgi:large subunit ribosomal protein L23